MKKLDREIALCKSGFIFSAWCAKLATLLGILVSYVFMVTAPRVQTDNARNLIISCLAFCTIFLASALEAKDEVDEARFKKLEAMLTERNDAAD